MVTDAVIQSLQTEDKIIVDYFEKIPKKNKKTEKKFIEAAGEEYEKIIHEMFIELNTFISLLDGAEYKGLIISLFTLSAGISRPFSGKLSDTIGRKRVMLVGMAVTFLVSLLYPISIGIGAFLLLRFLHGFSAGFLPTGATALITDIIPADRRGQAMGIWGTFISLGIGISLWLQGIRQLPSLGVDGSYSMQGVQSSGHLNCSPKLPCPRQRPSTSLFPCLYGMCFPLCFYSRK